jgi:hypothetical protein
MDMSVDGSRGENMAFSSQYFGGDTNDHARGNTIHDMRVTRFTDSFNDTIFDSNVSLYNSKLKLDVIDRLRKHGLILSLTL